MDFTIRMKTLIRHLVSEGIISSQKDLGHKMGYDNESYFSQLVNEKVPINRDFISRLYSIYDDFNADWLLYGSGEMVMQPATSQETDEGVRERLIHFIERKGLHKREFEKICDLSNGYVNNISKGIGIETLNKILEKFPDLDRNWLLFGDGEVFANNATLTKKADAADNAPLQATSPQECIYIAQAQISKAQQQISESQKQIDKVLDMIGKS